MPLFKYTFSEPQAKRRLSEVMSRKNSTSALVDDSTKSEYRRMSMKVVKDAQKQMERLSIAASASATPIYIEDDEVKSNTPIKDELVLEIGGFGQTLEW